MFEQCDNGTDATRQCQYKICIAVGAGSFKHNAPVALLTTGRLKMMTMNKIPGMPCSIILVTIIIMTMILLLIVSNLV